MALLRGDLDSVKELLLIDLKNLREENRGFSRELKRTQKHLNTAFKPEAPFRTVPKLELPTQQPTVKYIMLPHQTQTLTSRYNHDTNLPSKRFNSTASPKQ